MAKKAKEVSDVTTINSAAVVHDVQAVQTLQNNFSSVAKILNYEGEYDERRLISEFRAQSSMAAEALLNAGKCLLLLKEGAAHGTFLSIVKEDLGLSARTAQNMMAAAWRYLQNPEIAPHVAKFKSLSKTKLLDLMSQNDEDLIQLAEGGTLAGFKLEEIETLTTDELKRALRQKDAEIDELNGTITAKDKLLTSKNQTIDKLQEKKELMKKATPDEVEANWRAQLAELVHEAEVKLRNDIVHCIESLREHANVNETSTPEALALVFASGLGQVQAALNAVCTEFDIDLAANANPIPWADSANSAN